MRSSSRFVAVCLVTVSFGLVGPALAAEPTPTAPASAKSTLEPKSTLEKVKAKGFVQCGSTVRPGLATGDSGGRWTGLEVEICRAVATAVFGPGGRYAYHKYESTKDYDLARAGEDQVSFFSYAEMLDQKLTDKLLPGPTVFIESLDMMVPVESSVRHPTDLAGESICFMIATAAANSLDAWFRERKIDYIPNAYQEDGELLDTYNVQRCRSIAGESTMLAAARLDEGVNHLKSRLLPDHLLSIPILATTPLKDDAQWAAIVAWTIDTLLNADARETVYRPNGLRAMTIDGEGLGLTMGWQKLVIDNVGSYSSIFKRTLGEGSRLKLEQGLNRTVSDGGILLPPFKQ